MPILADPRERRQHIDIAINEPVSMSAARIARAERGRQPLRAKA
jgi:hypothetical protein